MSLGFFPGIYLQVGSDITSIRSPPKTHAFLHPVIGSGDLSPIARASRDLCDQKKWDETVGRKWEVFKTHWLEVCLNHHWAIE